MEMKLSSKLSLMVAFIVSTWRPGSVIAGENSVFLRSSMTLGDYNKYIFPIYHKTEQDGLKLQSVNTQIPSMMVYDPSGTLIFYGKESTQDAAFLRNFPASAKGLGKTDGLFLRDDLFQEVPEFAKAKGAIESDHHYLVFAITRSPFHKSCADQDMAVKE